MTTTSSSPPTCALSDKLAFVEAVAAPGRTDLIVIDETNVGSPAVWSPATAERPYAVRVGAGNRFFTVALDFDSKRQGPEAVLRDVETITTLYGAANIGYVVAVSGPTGGRHVLATVPDGLQAVHVERFAARLVHLGLDSLDTSGLNNVRSGAIRPPFSPHRSGGHSQPEGDVAEALQMLREGNPSQAFRALIEVMPDARSGDGPLQGESSAQKGHQGDPQREYVSGSEHTQAILTSVANSGGTVSAAIRAVLDSPHPQVRDRVAKLGTRVTQSLTKDFKTAKAFVRDRPATNSDASDVDVLVAWHTQLPAVEADLPAAARRVAPVVLREAHEYATRLVGLSVRRIAELGNMSRMSAQRGLEELRARHMLELAGEAAQGRATRHRLQPRDSWCSVGTGTGSPSSWGGVGGLTVPLTLDCQKLAYDLGANVWSRQGLGDQARRVYRFVADNEARGMPITTVADLSSELHLTESTIRKYLVRLGEISLMRRVGPAQWSAEYRSDYDVSFDLGIVGLRERRVAQHRTERRADAIRHILFRLGQSRAHDGTVPADLRVPAEAIA